MILSYIVVVSIIPPDKGSTGIWKVYFVFLQNVLCQNNEICLKLLSQLAKEKKQKRMINTTATVKKVCYKQVPSGSIWFA